MASVTAAQVAGRLPLGRGAGPHPGGIPLIITAAGAVARPAARAAGGRRGDGRIPHSVKWTDAEDPIHHATAGGASRRVAHAQRSNAMGLLDFVREAGEKLFGTGTAKAKMQEAAAAPSDAAKVKAADDAAADAIVAYIRSQNLSATAMVVSFDSGSATATVYGVAPDQATMEKIVLCCGNVAGVARVNNMMSVDHSQPEAVYYTVVSGDNLSKIAKKHYGDANKYMQIYEANTPMLKHPDKIYPGQVLRIPPL
jgi:nucleoid-associated protein YgaU